VIRRLYIHNFRCLENFELLLSGQSSVLLIGKNGSGKSSVRVALEILQSIGRGTTVVRDVVRREDFAKTDFPMRFEIEVDLHGSVCEYSVAFIASPGFKEVSLFEERFSVDGKPKYWRESDLKTGVPRSASRSAVDELQSDKTQLAAAQLTFRIVALPILGNLTLQDPAFLFTRWLSRTLLLSPIPSQITGDSGPRSVQVDANASAVERDARETFEPNRSVTNLGAWFTGLVASAPSAYACIAETLKQFMPDFDLIHNPTTGRDSRSLMVQFASSSTKLSVPFEDLSDGEKCFTVCALVLAAVSSDAYNPPFCFWDEPDNHLAPDEVQHFVIALRRAFRSKGQFIATSHNPEAIRSFADENTFLLHRKSHLEPTQVRSLESLDVRGDLVGALTRGDLEP